MVSIDQSQDMLNQLGAEMFNLCLLQLENAIEAFLTLDKDLAEKVLHMKCRVDALDLKFDRDCEQFLILHKPVAGDLRFLLALRKINFDLKQIEDYARDISSKTTELNILPDMLLLKSLRLDEMFSCVTSMLEDISEAYIDKDSQRAHKVFKKEQVLNKINNTTMSVISKLVKNEVELVDQILLLFTVIKKVEKVGDLATNIAQEIIFYREDDVQNHHKKKLLI